MKARSGQFARAFALLLVSAGATSAAHAQQSGGPRAGMRDPIGGPIGGITAESIVQGTVLLPAADLEGALDPMVYRRVMLSRVAGFRACYSRALRTNPTVGGRFVLSWTITATGVVTNVQIVQSPAMIPAELTACVRGLVARIRFPAAPTGPTSVEQAFVVRLRQ